MRISCKQFASALASSTVDATEVHVSEAAGEVIRHLAKEHRLHLVPNIIRALNVVWRERFGASRIRVASAHPLPKSSLAKIEALAPGADLEVSVQPALIGGAIVQLDDHRIDGSIAGALTRLEISLKNDE